MTAVTDLADKVKAAYGLMQPLDDEPMLNFNERDLLAFAENAGFKMGHLADARSLPRPLRYRVSGGRGLMLCRAEFAYPDRRA